MKLDLKPGGFKYKTLCAFKGPYLACFVTKVIEKHLTRFEARVAFRQGKLRSIRERKLVFNEPGLVSEIVKLRS